MAFGFMNDEILWQDLLSLDEVEEPVDFCVNIRRLESGWWRLTFYQYNEIVDRQEWQGIHKVKETLQAAGFYHNVDWTGINEGFSSTLYMHAEPPKCAPWTFHDTND